MTSDRSFSTVRLGAVCAVAAVFAIGFTTVLRYTETARSSVFDAKCRVSSDPDCFGPHLR